MALSLDSRICVIVTEFLNLSQQRKGSVYVCELCKNHNKGVELVSSSENGRLSSIPQQIERETVSSDANPSPQLPWRQGKVCNLNLFEQPCFQVYRHILHLQLDPEVLDVPHFHCFGPNVVITVVHSRWVSSKKTQNLVLTWVSTECLKF